MPPQYRFRPGSPCGRDAAAGVAAHEVVDRERLSGPGRSEERKVESGGPGRPTRRRQQRDIGEGVLLQEGDQRIEVERLAEEVAEVVGQPVDREGPSELDGLVEPMMQHLPKVVEELRVHRADIHGWSVPGSPGGLARVGPGDLVEQELTELVGIGDLEDLLAAPTGQLGRRVPVA